MDTKYPLIRRCRLCGCEEKFAKLKEIFDDSELNLETKIKKLLPVVVMPWDPFPHTICSNCIEKLNLFNEFYDETLKTESLLRKFFPSASESKTEYVDPIIQITEWPRKIKTPLKLPPTNFPKDESTDSFDSLPHPNTKFPCVRTSEGFIINPLNSKDFIYTCRKCSRTFTKQSSALRHDCVKIEDCGELERIGEVGNSLEESLSPFQICLFSTEPGDFECSVRNKPFALKGAMEKHSKTHSLPRQVNPRKKFKGMLKNRPETVSEESKTFERANDNEISFRFTKEENETGSLDANNENLSKSHKIKSKVKIKTKHARLTCLGSEEPSAKDDNMEASN